MRTKREDGGICPLSRAAPKPFGDDEGGGDVLVLDGRSQSSSARHRF